MIAYNSQTGRVTGEVTGQGYSGHDAGLNNPNMEQLRGIGPIPRGKWKILRWDDHHGEKGPIVAVLEPDGWDAYGRSDFLIHGDNPEANHSASHGCIIMNHDIRTVWRATGIMEFEVI